MPALLRARAGQQRTTDSIACLAGAFLGLAAWPPHWQAQIEYADQLAALGQAWD